MITLTMNNYKSAYILLLIIVEVSMYWKFPSEFHCRNISFEVIDVSGGVVVKFNDI